MTAAQWSDGAAGPALSLFDEMTTPDGTWQDSAACAGADPDAWFPAKGHPTAYAKRVCAGCPVRPECLDYALDFERGMGRETRHGVWGGLAPDQRWAADRAARKTAA
ncbi:MAG: WhiB family transcriptional regulator [Actinomycetota bacterium]|nr:WhiB family transcriptional regulator [Actinomycetota bacterium]